MAANGLPDGCIAVTSPFWPVEDVWPPGTLTQECMMAYKLLHKRGEIEITNIRFNRKTLVVRMEYMTMEPEEEKRRHLLKQAKKDALMLDDATWVQLQMDKGL